MSVSILFLAIEFVMLSSASACDRCVHKAKAAYFMSSSALSVGACGYGSLAPEFTGGFVAGANTAIYRAGIACGDCFQIRCRDEELCSGAGVKVILTDLNSSNTTDFVLSRSAFMAMGRPGRGFQLAKLGVVDVDYKRIPCEYGLQNLSVSVQSSSINPDNLEIIFLYQGGQTEVVAVNVAQVGPPLWQSMARSYGAVWRTDYAPPGPLQFRLLVTGGYDGSWVWANQAVLPADWKITSVYDAGVQITAVAQEPCSPCDTSHWM